MIRASFTVVTNDGRRYDANRLTISMEQRYDEDRRLGGMGSVLSFICSGQMTTLRAEEVKSVEYRPTGAGHCGECDGPLRNVQGHGAHANPVASP